MTFSRGISLVSRRLSRYRIDLEIVIGKVIFKSIKSIPRVHNWFPYFATIQRTCHNHSQLLQKPKISEIKILQCLQAMKCEPKKYMINCWDTIWFCSFDIILLFNKYLRDVLTITGICSTKNGRSFKRTALNVALAFWPLASCPKLKS